MYGSNQTDSHTPHSTKWLMILFKKFHNTYILSCSEPFWKNFKKIETNILQKFVTCHNTWNDTPCIERGGHYLSYKMVVNIVLNFQAIRG